MQITLDYRKNVLKRDNYICVCCTNKKDLHVHHIIPFEFGGENSLNNLVTVCIQCHQIIHFIGNNVSNWDIVNTSLIIKNSTLSKLNMLNSSPQTIAILEFAELIAKERLSFPKSAKESISFLTKLNNQSLVTLQEAAQACVKKNKHLTEILSEKLIIDFVSQTWNEIPEIIRQDFSIASTHRGQTIAINHHNHLIFRIPARTDLGREVTSPDVFLISTLNGSLSRKFDEVFSFKLFNAINVSISMKSFNKLSRIDWEDFALACQYAANAKKTRSRRSNIDPKSII